MPTLSQPEEWNAEMKDPHDYPPSALEPPKSRIKKEEIPWPEGSIFRSNNKPRPGLFPT